MAQKNIIVPVDFHKRTSMDYLYDFFKKYFMQNRQQSQDLHYNVEIEARLGEILSRLDNRPLLLTNLLVNELSFQNVQIVSVETPFQDLQLHRYFALVQSEKQYHFQSGVEEEIYYKMLDYFKFYQKIRSDKQLVNLPDTLSVDFLFIDGPRFEYNILNKTFQKLKKVDKSNMTMAHLGTFCNYLRDYNPSNRSSY